MTTFGAPVLHFAAGHQGVDSANVRPITPSKASPAGVRMVIRAFPLGPCGPGRSDMAGAESATGRGLPSAGRQRPPFRYAAALAVFLIKAIAASGPLIPRHRNTLPSRRSLFVQKAMRLSVKALSSSATVLRFA